MFKLSVKSWIFLFFIFFVALLSAGFLNKNYLIFSIKNIAGISAGFRAPEVIENQEEMVLHDLPPDKTGLLSGGEPKNAPVLTKEEKQNLIDDLQEKIDLIKWQIAELEKKKDPEIKEEENKEEKKEEENQEKQEQKIYPKTMAGAAVKINYSKILISEIQLLPLGQRFIELYNPNSQPLSLTGWYLQRKTKTSQDYSSLISSTLFSGKIIGSNDYFLISRELAGSDILSDITLTEDNFLVLKNPNEEISDKLGFGSSQDFETSPSVNPAEGQSLGRKFDEMLQNYVDADNNSADFEISGPTPNAKNKKYVAPQNIIINEVQICGLADGDEKDENEEFVELYNPNNFSVNLTSYVLRRVRSSGTVFNYVESGSFSGKIIGSNDYFLIAGDGSSFAKNNTADIVTDNSLGDWEEHGGSTLILKKAYSSSFFDKLGFGEVADFLGTAPSAYPAKGESVGRVDFGDTNDNSADFKIFIAPTPGRKNEQPFN